MIGGVLKGHPRARLLAASVAFVYCSSAAAGFLGTLLVPAMVADWSGDRTSIPDDASPSGYSIVTYRGSMEISRRPATAADLEESRYWERFWAKLAIVLFGCVLEGGLLWAAWKTNGWMIDESSPRSWRVGAAIVFLGLAATLMIYTVLVYGGVAPPNLANEQRRFFLAAFLPYWALWAGGGLRVLMFQHPSETSIVQR